MIEWLLSDNGTLTLQLTIMISIVIILLGSFIYHIHSFHDSYALIIGFIVSFTIIGMYYIFEHNTKFSFISNENWKQIYTNNLDAKVTITDNHKNILVNKDIVAGEKLDYNYKLFNNKTKSNTSFAEIKIKKDDTSYSKQIIIKKENITINGELNKESIITKIEYRNIEGHQKSLFGHNGPIEKDNIEGELRITIEQNPKREELKQLFENNE